MAKKLYNSIDMVKLICCLFVISLHTKAFQDILPENIYWYLDHGIFRIAVPFFFVASGFMIGSKIKKNPLNLKQSVKGYATRLLIPLVVFEVINIALEAIRMFSEGKSIVAMILYFGRSVIFYPLGALWYVQASIIAIIMLYFFIKKNMLNKAIILGLVLYCFALIANSYYFLVEGTLVGKIIDLYLHYCVSARNGVFVGFIFIGLGIWLAFNASKLKLSTVWSIFIISTITFFLEVSFVYNKNFADDGALFVSLIFLIPSLTMLLTRLQLKVSDNISILARNLSTGLFYLHIPIRQVVLMGSGIIAYDIPNITLFTVVTLLGVIICLISYKFRIKYTDVLLK